MKALKGIVISLFLAGGGISFALAIAEVFLRVSRIPIARHSDHMFTVIEHDARLGWKMKPRIDDIVDLLDTENIPVRTNSAGLWDKEFSQVKAPGEFRIALLGDSITWGYGVAEEERFGNVLERLDTQYECMNFGIPAYGTDQELLMWRYMASQYQPDLVILTVYSVNDYDDNMSDIRWGRSKPYFEFNTAGDLEMRNLPLPKTTFWDHGIMHEIAPPYRSLCSQTVERRSRIADWLVKHSDVVRLIYTASNRRTSASGNTSDASPVPKEVPVSPKQEMEIRLLNTLVKKLAAEVTAKNSRFLVVLAGPFGVPYSHLTNELSKDQVPYLDVTSHKLQQELGGGENRVYLPYSGHWTVAANKAVPDLLHRKITEMRVVKP